MTKNDAKKLTYKINTEITENNITTDTKQVRSPYLPMTENISDVEENTTTAEIFANAKKVINTNEDMDFNNNEIFYARKICAEELELDIHEKYHYDDCDYTFLSMFPAPHYRERRSMMLSEVLDDLGVNDQMVMRERKLMKMLETVSTITMRLTGTNITSYFMGSQSECTRISSSDADILLCVNTVNIIQDLSEWEHGKDNYLMIQDENTTPGYCFLQLFRSNEPMPATDIPNNLHISERRGILCKNTIKLLDSSFEQHGPSITSQGRHGFCDKDLVLALPCKSWPQSASGWLERQGVGRWPTHEMRRLAARTRCFVVPTGSKVSVYPELEWRLSTSLTERYLMFSLNITQIRCYVLLKMILKSFLNPQGEINISSYMIKTVLFHCIENTEPSIWIDNNLLTCLIFCLQELHSCVQNEHCSHFIISEINLMTGQFTSETVHELSENISVFIQNDFDFLITLGTNDLGYRLLVKLNKVPQKVYGPPFSLAIPVTRYLSFALPISYLNFLFLKRVQNENMEKMNQIVTILVFLMTYDINNGETLTHTGLKFLAPFTFTTYGSTLASFNFGAKNQALRKAMNWLSAGLNSDVSSGRLKLASVFYSREEMEKAEEILRQTEQKYLSHYVVPICSCAVRSEPTISEEIARYCYEHSEDSIKDITAFCVRFIRQEINCVPHELQYEMFRSTQDDMIHRGQYDCWMDWAVIDSLPFLYFLQYKLYGHLQRQQEKQQAFDNLIRTIETNKKLTHRETALNVLGQIMEQENRPHEALHCYIHSLQERARNNVAKIHICRLLCKCNMVLRFLNVCKFNTKFTA
ncbi:uncharacterized protein LOC132755199 [Ruditapes philippinarum]|uniref:uncharacterized protein LOC132755199 n=1 Tax=Ruditapes philippinarum TaxID=129788 RepID=UPI00295BB300|nr:uncharacterized protein LOC132755199 [Ruditapes philippinarum]